MVCISDKTSSNLSALTVFVLIYTIFEDFIRVVMKLIIYLWPEYLLDVIKMFLLAEE